MYPHLPETAVLVAVYLRLATNDKAVYAYIRHGEGANPSRAYIKVGLLNDGGNTEVDIFDIFPPDDQEHYWRLFFRFTKDALIVGGRINELLSRMASILIEERVRMAQQLFDFDLDRLLNDGMDRTLK